MAEGGGYRSDCHRGCALGLAARHLCGHDIVVERLEAEQTCGHFAVEREGGAVAGGGAERVLVGYIVGRDEHLHVVAEAFGIGSEP